METQKEIINDKNLKSEKNWLSSTGRIGRGAFVFRMFIIPISALLLAVLTIAILIGIFNPNANAEEISQAVVSVLSFYSLIVLYLWVVQIIKRLHDCGWSGWWVILCAYPFLFFPAIILFFIKGNPHDNKYGKVGKVTILNIAETDIETTQPNEISNSNSEINNPKSTIIL